MHEADGHLTLDALEARLAALEGELVRLRAASTSAASGGAVTAAPPTESPLLSTTGTDHHTASAHGAAVVASPLRRMRSRRSIMSTAAKVAAASAGVGALVTLVDVVKVGGVHASGTEAATEFSDNGSYAVFGHATTDSANGVLGQSPGNSGVRGISDTAHGVDGISTSGSGVVGTTSGVPQTLFAAASGGSFPVGLAAFPLRPLSGNITGAGTVGINVSDDAAGIGVWGLTLHPLSGGLAGGIGVQGQSRSGIGVNAFSETGTALQATCAADDGVALRAAGLLQVTGAAVGQATLPAHTSAVTVTTVAATPNSLIVLTPVTDPHTRLWVTRASGSFTIHASIPPATSVGIAYLVIN